MDLDKINYTMGALLQVRGEDLYRMKGILAIQGSDQRCVAPSFIMEAQQTHHSMPYKVFFPVHCLFLVMPNVLVAPQVIVCLLSRGAALLFYSRQPACGTLVVPL